MEDMETDSSGQYGDLCEYCKEGRAHFRPLSCNHQFCLNCCNQMVLGGEVICKRCTGGYDYLSPHEACSSDATPGKTRHTSGADAQQPDSDKSPLKKEHDKNVATIFHTLEKYKQRGNRPEIRLDTEKADIIHSHVAVHDDGTVYISDLSNHRIHKCRIDGEIWSSFGQHGSHLAEFNEPHGLTIADDGVVFIADRKNKRVHIRYPNKWDKIDVEVTQGITFEFLTGVAYHNFTLYCADHKCIKIFDRMSNFRTYRQFSHPDIGCLYDVAVDDEFIYASDNSCVRKFSLQGELVKTIGDGRRKGHYRGLALDGYGRLLVCDHNNSCLKVFRTEDSYLHEDIPLPGKPISVAIYKGRQVLVTYLVEQTEGVVAVL